MDIGPLAPARLSCRHPDAARVLTVGGEHVGWLCPDCDAVLPPDRLEWPIPGLPPWTPDPRLTMRIQE
jgi:hypothetical protein